MPNTTVEISKVDQIDWSRAGFVVGVDLAGREDWVPLDEDDIRILHGLLTRPVAIRMDDGSPNFIGPVANASERLKTVADTLASMIGWYEKQRAFQEVPVVTLPRPK